MKHEMKHETKDERKRGERMSLFDRFVTGRARRVARATGRRHFLARLGALLVGAGAVPLLPVARAAMTDRAPTDRGQAAAPTGQAAAPTKAAAPTGQAADPTDRGQAAAPTNSPRAPQPQEQGDALSCDYWRYCALDGFLCGCCGGSASSCPPGTEPAPVTWIGTCRNPVDGKDYVISYNDCCGKNACGRCLCQRNDGDKPVYVPARANDIDWCMGSVGVVYNSTVALVLGVATDHEER